MAGKVCGRAVCRNVQGKISGLISSGSGEHLLPETADNAVLGQQERKVMVILRIIPRLYDPDSVVKQCDLIVVKLAEEGNNR